MIFAFVKRIYRTRRNAPLPVCIFIITYNFAFVTILKLQKSAEKLHFFYFLGFYNKKPPF